MTAKVVVLDGDATGIEAYLHPIVGEPLTELIPNNEKEAFGVGQFLNKGT